MDEETDRPALIREERQLFNHLAVAKPGPETSAKLHRYRRVLQLLKESEPPPPPPEPVTGDLFEEAR